jgi:hypothetical protein
MTRHLRQSGELTRVVSEIGGCVAGPAVEMILSVGISSDFGIGVADCPAKLSNVES